MERTGWRQATEEDLEEAEKDGETSGYANCVLTGSDRTLDRLWVIQTLSGARTVSGSEILSKESSNSV